MPGFLWELVKKDGEIIVLPEAAARDAKAQWVEGKVINFTNQAIAPSQIKEIYATSRIDTAGQRLLADAEAALSKDQPIMVKLENGENAVKVLCLVKRVTTSEWNKRYSKDSTYSRVSTLEGYWVAYPRPAHLGIPPGQQLCGGRCDAAQKKKNGY